MMQEIYNDCKVQVLRDGTAYFVRFDGGTVAAMIMELPVTEAEARQLMQAGEGALDLLLRFDRERLAGARFVYPGEYVGNTGKLYC